MFEGVSVALVTPFRENGLDEAAFVRVIHHVLDQGVHGLVVTGSTGEAATLGVEERETVWRTAVREAAGRAWVIAGTGTNDTAASIELGLRAEDAGVDGVMAVVPFYNKPTPDGLVAHFTAIADASRVPVMLYNVPGRTALDMKPAVVCRLQDHPRIVAIKEASGSADRITELLRETGLTVLAGDDSMALPFAAAGARGLVSVAGHLVGDRLVTMLEAHAQGRVEEAAGIHRQLFGLIEALFVESNPAPVKAALAELGLIENRVRLPLVPAGDATRDRVVAEMRAVGARRPGAEPASGRV